MKIVLSVILKIILSVNLYSSMEFVNECSVEYPLMLSLATQERHPAKEIGYPYLISINLSNDKLLAKKNVTKNYWLDKRTIDCKNSENCVKIYKKLYSLGIKNVDLGAYQINPKFHKHKESDYFMLDKSYIIACKFIESLNKELGWSWETIASYHSRTPNLNNAYKKRIQKIYKGYVQNEN
ncbi:MAG: hypothetical protein COB67_00295 [SAR324 cluster bacterium]|uniref:Transglycosylase SLT domain-containing protein n=1 Tax=SAR324 cluster bacterium TaxID=2024889 RepID=A0A2A4TC92_9DELT|nr:MAG: hypothetical protein COB67_00295 [SAR324 cluster bacterium]